MNTLLFFRNWEKWHSYTVGKLGWAEFTKLQKIIQISQAHSHVYLFHIYLFIPIITSPLNIWLLIFRTKTMRQHRDIVVLTQRLKVAITTHAELNYFVCVGDPTWIPKIVGRALSGNMKKCSLLSFILCWIRDDIKTMD